MDSRQTKGLHKSNVGNAINCAHTVWIYRTSVAIFAPLAPTQFASRCSALAVLWLARPCYYRRKHTDRRAADSDFTWRKGALSASVSVPTATMGSTLGASMSYRTVCGLAVGELERFPKTTQV